MTALFGGIAAAAIGGVGLAQAASTKPTPALPRDEAIDSALEAGLDATDAEFAQVVRRRTVVRRDRFGRPVVVRRTVVRRPGRRRVIVRRRVYRGY